MAELYNAFRRKMPTVGEEMADVAIYLLGMAVILNIDLGAEIDRKIEINERRKYENMHGVNIRISD